MNYGERLKLFERILRQKYKTYQRLRTTRNANDLAIKQAMKEWEEALFHYGTFLCENEDLLHKEINDRQTK